MTYVTILLFVLLLWMYVILCLRRYTGDFELIQVQLHNLNPNLVFEKKPILVHAHVPPKHLQNTILRFQYLFEKKGSISSSPEIIRYKWAIIHNKNSLSTIEIGMTDQSMFSIKLDPHNVLLVPAGWYISASSEIDDVDVQYIDDIIHFLFLKKH